MSIQERRKIIDDIMKNLPVGTIIAVDFPNVGFNLRKEKNGYSWVGKDRHHKKEGYSYEVVSQPL